MKGVKPITEDIERLSAMCRAVGYLSAFCDKEFADAWADRIVNYMAELFKAKRGGDEE